MRGFVQGADRQQMTLFPECLDDWVDESNSIRAVDVFVDALELRDLGFDGVDPAATGRPAYHPSPMLGVTSKVRKSWPVNRPVSRSRCPSRKPRAPSRQAALGNLILFIWPRMMSIAALPARSWRTTSPLMKVARKCGFT